VQRDASSPIVLLVTQTLTEQTESYKALIEELGGVPGADD
jgi:hypothetical protein